MNYSRMNGYEFEDFVAKLLARAGFFVTQTAYSHDGGIDLLATHEKHLFSGKYIVQCKNYSGLVGQPEVRDLYGVVMSENANKGILITPSDYTEDAYSFAKGKNIELVNGTILDRIVSEYMGTTPEETINISEMIEGFNIDQYNYLMQCIDHDPTSPKFYLKAIDFLRNAIIEDAPYVQSASIFEKLIDVNERLMKRCCKGRGEEKRRLKYDCWYRIAEVEMVRGNLGVATNILLDNDIFYIKRWCMDFSYLYSYLKHGISRNIPMDPMDDLFDEAHPVYPYPLSKNLYRILKSIHHPFACKEIVKKLSYASEESELERFSEEHCRYDYENYLEQVFEIAKSAAEDLEHFLSGRHDDVFYFSDPSRNTKYIKSTISRIKKYYSKPDHVLIQEVNMALKQHGIVAEDNSET